MYSRSLLNALVDDLLIGLGYFDVPRYPRYTMVQGRRTFCGFVGCACKARLKCRKYP